MSSQAHEQSQAQRHRRTVRPAMTKAISVGFLLAGILAPLEASAQNPNDYGGGSQPYQGNPGYNQPQAGGQYFPPPGQPGMNGQSEQFNAQQQPQYQQPYQQPYQPPLQGQVAVIGAGTQFQAALVNSLNSGTTQLGEQVQVTLGQGLMGSNGGEAVPAGSTLIGSVTNVVSAKRFKFGANGKIDIKFTSLRTPDGRVFPLSASVDDNQVKLVGGSTAGRVGKGVLTTAVGAGGGAALGTGLGAIVGATSHGQVGRATGMGAVFGTAIGGGVGLVGAGVRKGSEVVFKAGQTLPVKLDQSFQVTVAGQPYRPPYGQPPQYGQPMQPQYGQPMQQQMQPNYSQPPQGSYPQQQPYQQPQQQYQQPQQQYQQPQQQPPVQQLPTQPAWTPNGNQ